MEVVDFTGTKEAGEFEAIPGGEYLCKAVEVDKKETKENKDTMYAIKWKVQTGEYRDRIIFDNIVFSEKAMPRAKKIFKELGYNVDGSLEINTSMVEGQCLALMVESYYQPNPKKLDKDGEPMVEEKNSITYAGFRALTEEEKDEVKEANDVPF